MARETPSDRAYTARAAERARSAHLAAFSPASERRAAAYRKAFGGGGLVPGLREDQTPTPRPAPARPRQHLPADQELRRSRISTQSPFLGTARPPAAPPTEYGRAQAAKRGEQVPGVRERPKTQEIPEWQMRRAELWNKHMRRELTDAEFAGLSPEQQSQVRLNNKLLQASDADRAAREESGSRENGNINGLLSQLGQPKTKGIGVPLTTSTAALGLGGEVTPAVSARQKQVRSLADSLQKFLATTEEEDAQAQLAPALARKDEFNFADPQAKETFELAFDYFMNPELGPESLGSWENAQLDLKAQGYNPDEFREYARTRLQMLPKIKGQLDLPTLDAWFGGS